MNSTFASYFLLYLSIAAGTLILVAFGGLGLFGLIEHLEKRHPRPFVWMAAGLVTLMATGTVCAVVHCFALHRLDVRDVLEAIWFSLLGARLAERAKAAYRRGPNSGAV